MDHAASYINTFYLCAYYFFATDALSRMFSRRGQNSASSGTRINILGNRAGPKRRLTSRPTRANKANEISDICI